MGGGVYSHSVACSNCPRRSCCPHQCVSYNKSPMHYHTKYITANGYIVLYDNCLCFSGDSVAIARCPGSISGAGCVFDDARTLLRTIRRSACSHSQTTATHFCTCADTSRDTRLLCGVRPGCTAGQLRGELVCIHQYQYFLFIVSRDFMVIPLHSRPWWYVRKS